MGVLCVYTSVEDNQTPGATAGTMKLPDKRPISGHTVCQSALTSVRDGETVVCGSCGCIHSGDSERRGTVEVRT